MKLLSTLFDKLKNNSDDNLDNVSPSTFSEEKSSIDTGKPSTCENKIPQSKSATTLDANEGVNASLASGKSLLGTLLSNGSIRIPSATSSLAPGPFSTPMI
ncbi:hypothetical protein VIN30_09470 [Adlercreutzia sp. R7]|uniref:Uncharacterized protein n=1 Tax=Adlercreutzia wanghongyangiae TaxID=3111451 RepID=A0ABU6IJM5_9ACTN|nr:hypothetical protein [Adlercreutzia sp. R7]